jgi:hypothetical protein
MWFRWSLDWDFSLKRLGFMFAFLEEWELGFRLGSASDA